MESLKNIVIDYGSYSFVAGYSGYSQPSVKFPHVVGRKRKNIPLIGIEDKSEYIGEEAVKMRGVLNLSCPVEYIDSCAVKYGLVTDWSDLELVF